jgi:hypothetical protein
MLFMFISALFDPLMFGASLVATLLFARRWLHVLVIGVAVGVLGEALLAPEFSDRLLAGVISATLQSALVFLVAERTRRRYAARLAMMR